MRGPGRRARAVGVDEQHRAGAEAARAGELERRRHRLRGVDGVEAEARGFGLGPGPLGRLGPVPVSGSDPAAQRGEVEAIGDDRRAAGAVAVEQRRRASGEAKQRPPVEPERVADHDPDDPGREAGEPQAEGEPGAVPPDPTAVTT